MKVTKIDNKKVFGSTIVVQIKGKDKSKKASNINTIEVYDNINIFNIINLHLFMLDHFTSLEHEIDNLKNEIGIYESIRDKSKIPVDINIASNKINHNKDLINNIISRGIRAEYILQSEYYLLCYNKMMKNSPKNVFGQISTINSELKDKLIDIINAYIDVCRKFRNINIVWNHKGDFKCPLCDLNILNNSNICECGCILNTFSKMTDTDKSDSNKISDKRKNFKLLLKRFQGKSRNIPRQVYDTIDKFIKEYNINKMNITRDQIKEILKRNKMSEYYPQLNSIYSEYTETKLLNISDDVEKLILDRYDMIDYAYTRIPKTREKSLSNNYVLNFILAKEGIIVDNKEQIKTRDVEISYEDIMKKICNLLKEEYRHMNWEFIDILKH